MNKERLIKLLDALDRIPVDKSWTIRNIDSEGNVIHESAICPVSLLPFAFPVDWTISPNSKLKRIGHTTINLTGWLAVKYELGRFFNIDRLAVDHLFATRAQYPGTKELTIITSVTDYKKHLERFIEVHG